MLMQAQAQKMQNTQTLRIPTEALQYFHHVEPRLASEAYFALFSIRMSLFRTYRNLCQIK